MTKDDLIRLWKLEMELAEEKRLLLFLTTGEEEFYRTKERIDTITAKMVALTAQAPD